MEYQRLHGLKAEPNIAATQIEDNLGIDFPDKPAHNLLTPQNKFMMLLNGVYRRDIRLAVVGLVLPKNIFGIYAPEYHTYFSRQANHFCELHENTHGLSNYLNPEVMKTVERAHSGLIVEKDPNSDPEKYIVTKSFIEGIAQWSAVKVAEITGDAATKRVSLLEHNRMYGVNGGKNKAKPNGYTNEQIKMMREVTEKLLASQESDGNRSVTHVFGLLRLVQEGLYAVGYEFTRKAMNYLNNQGADVRTGLVMLHSNPPTTLNDLSRPKDFVRSLATPTRI